MTKSFQPKYLIHSPDNWSKDDIEAIRSEFYTLGFQPSKDAAIGEGAGGHGFETVIEFLLENPVTTGLISALIYDVVKTMFVHKPKKDATPQGFPETYRLVVHIKNNETQTIIGINLKDNQQDIEVAISEKLDKIITEGHSKIEQVEDGWEDYDF